MIVWRCLVLVLVAPAAFAACAETSDGLHKARVQSNDKNGVCVIPEDPAHDDTAGCYPASASDALKLTIDVCFEARFPFPNDGKRAIYRVRVLERKCKR
jgi:hypothetical protein